MPNDEVEAGEAKLGKWDIPSRILIGTSFILLITGSASFIGPRLTGLLTMIPLYVTILAIFAHRHQGPRRLPCVARFLYGMFAYGILYHVRLVIEKAGIGFVHLAIVVRWQSRESFGYCAKNILKSLACLWTRPLGKTVY
jgi:hypothetical protein